MTIDYIIIAAYIVAMICIGWFSMRLVRTKSDYLVAGRRLGSFMYSGTMSAVVIGGASTIGGIGLGYSVGLSGMWFVVSIGLGVFLLSVFFARRIVRLKIYTVSEMMDLRYGGSTGIISAMVMTVNTLMLAVTSTLAYATIFGVLFDLSKVAAVIIGGSIVVFYSVLGGMWSITLTDIVQFMIKTFGILLLLLPIAYISSGGFSKMSRSLPPEYFALDQIGLDKIISFVLLYTLGCLIGQDMWQRVFTARSPEVATRGGVWSAAYCMVYALAGAVIGMAAKVNFPDLSSPDDAFAAMVTSELPVGVRGLVLAAALAAVMSTSSGALIACSTVTANDIVGPLRKRRRTGENLHGNRLATLLLGVVTIALALSLDSVLDALTLAYNLLIAGLLVPIVGALFWKRATRMGAVVAMVSGSLAAIICMLVFGPAATEPLYIGLAMSFVGYVAGSLLSVPTDQERVDRWTKRLADSKGEVVAEVRSVEEALD